MEYLYATSDSVIPPIYADFEAASSNGPVRPQGTPKPARYTQAPPAETIQYLKNGFRHNLLMLLWLNLLRMASE
jgi:hypothetical protein